MNTMAVIDAGLKGAGIFSTERHGVGALLWQLNVTEGDHLLSLVNHACVPNAIVVESSVQACKAIEPGQEVTIRFPAALLLRRLRAEAGAGAPALCSGRLSWCGDGETKPTMKSVPGSSTLPKAEPVDNARAKLPDAGPENFSRSKNGSLLMRAQFRILKEDFLKPAEDLETRLPEHFSRKYAKMRSKTDFGTRILQMLRKLEEQLQKKDGKEWLQLLAEIPGFSTALLTPARHA
ncbi:hypothetical protein AK812_SmicGene1101 [Symbiodinium microadriaticum]|uniref:Uncharacterized protein n=1 Tax=Symbiodinium microadriaticum TaxID=2951 RepID=A0A1Q9F514_SYMMI|nr:hypothetical protein AK812_SmicGene1101 [Symbiodinium microadriaticum]CAE7892486.1 unnamed protein product [Symbiodinium microadriaticum]CAE7937908.1 unnamed protein product [Symbiodinium sp. KB8]